MQRLTATLVVRSQIRAVRLLILAALAQLLPCALAVPTAAAESFRVTVAKEGVPPGSTVDRSTSGPGVQRLTCRFYPPSPPHGARCEPAGPSTRSRSRAAGGLAQVSAASARCRVVCGGCASASGSARGRSYVAISPSQASTHGSVAEVDGRTRGSLPLSTRLGTRRVLIRRLRRHPLARIT